MKNRIENAATQVRRSLCITAKAMLLVTASWVSAQGFALAQTTGAGKAVPAAEWTKIVEAAKKEGSVTIYSPQGLVVLNELGDKFKKEYGITLQVVRQGDFESWPKVDAEFSTGRGIADVFVGDLGSINGTYVNGHMIKSREKLHDRDVNAIGNFRIQFLASSEHEPAEVPNHEETTAMSISALHSLGFEGTSGARQASLKVLSGSSEGLEVPVVKAVTTFGQPGVAMVSISHRRNGYFVVRVDGDGPSTLNGMPIGDQAVPLEHHDVLELAGTAMEFLLKEAV